MKKNIILFLTIIAIISCKQKSGESKAEREMEAPDKEYTASTVETAVGPLELAAPYATESVAKISKLTEWPEGQLPKAPEGFTVSKFAEGFDNPRWTYIAPNNDIFVVESNTRKSANRITILRDKNGDGEFEVRQPFLENLNQPFGMLVINNYFYVANTDALWRYTYKRGQTSLKDVEGEKIVSLPAGGYNNHWTRNIITNEAKDKIYISVGSASNVAEHGMEEEIRRANILEVNLDGSGEVIYASGLRNPVGMDWNPSNGELWTAVNERDKLGDNLVPDYITSVKKGGFYGWPYSYYGQIRDPRLLDKEVDSLVEAAIVPDVATGNHTASLGFTFYTADQFPEKYKNGAFVGQHGSWNRKNFSGYKVVFVPFENGEPNSKSQDFLSGFIAEGDGSQVYGRPVGVTVATDGSLLVNDDTGGVIWKVQYAQ
ncbi:PQQ-dependent sugar dehydrogenase [Luteirhabdus pelagi]|uniref:PQQ-dependent sugar dehydrogenase n=1 Tax=Luteirhabdus pelagi TaxID=2792783 RepID=UPI00193A9D9B|nr:sorbosone dehydrogenase family protein [Luteirhabdus pelagi]